MLAGHCPNCLVQTALDSDRATAAAEQPVSFPRAFGDYELLEEVARGGMGIVYRARQRSLNRMVAIKMILAGEFASPEFVRRFRHEAAAAASLQHAHIVAIHEVGETSGQHYFSMDLVEGRNLAELVRDQTLPARRAATYVRTIAEAVHFAHEKGILHRDLKPSNILIDAFDQPRITDFGLAKEFRSGAELTQSGQALGSPAYMPPEQAAGKHGGASPASDLYSLGAILYHLLTGRPPFQGETLHQVLLQVQGTEPIAPRRLNPGVPEDLQTICLKCLEKDPTRRYPTARDFADELGRFMRDEPIAARPIGAVDRIWRWCRRRPAVASLSASVLLLLFVVAFGSSFAVWQVDQARQAEQAANRDLRQTVNLLELERAEDFFTAHDSAAGVAHLAAMLRRDPSNSIAANRLMSAMVHRRWAVPGTPPLRHAGRVPMASFSPDGRLVLSACWDKTACVWNAATGERVVTVRHDNVVCSARFSPDGRRFVTASADGTARVWDATTGAALTSWLRHDDKVTSAEFSGDGQFVLTASVDQSAKVWNAASGVLVRELRGRSGGLVTARFSSDGKLVATASEQSVIQIWNAESGEILFHISTPARIPALAFSPDGRRLVSAHEDGTVRLWDSITGAVLGDPIVHRLVVWHAEFSPDSKLLLTTCEDGAARVWDVQTLRPICEPLRHESGVIFGQFSPDGRNVVTTSSDYTARVWDVRTQTPLCQPLRHIGHVLHANFSPDGRRLVSASYSGAAQVWDLRDRLDPVMAIHHDVNVAPFAFSSDGAVLLTAAHDKTARLWEARTGHALTDPIRHADWVWSGDFAPDGRRVVTACGDGSVRVWDCGEGKAAPDRMMVSPRLVVGPFGHSNGVFAVRFNANGARLATASADGTARVWDATSGRPITPSLVHTGEVLTAQFSRDGRLVVTASRDRTARVWDAQSGQPVTEPLVHRDHVHWAEFSPDGERVITASTDDTACIWNVRTGRPIVPPLQHPRMVGRAVFSPDGRRVATASIDRTARIWDASTGQALTPPLPHDSFVERVYFTSDGQRLVTICRSGLARVWDSTTGRPLTEWLNAGNYWMACFDPTAERIALGTAEGIVHIWKIQRAPTPVPEWFPAFAEAVAGIRLAERGAMELAPRQKLKDLVTQITPNASTNEYERLASWFGLPLAR